MACSKYVLLAACCFAVVVSSPPIPSSRHRRSHHTAIRPSLHCRMPGPSTRSSTHGLHPPLPAATSPLARRPGTLRTQAASTRTRRCLHQWSLQAAAVDHRFASFIQLTKPQHYPANKHSVTQLLSNPIGPTRTLAHGTPPQPAMRTLRAVPSPGLLHMAEPSKGPRP